MIVTQSNLDYLIVPVRMHIGDIAGDVFSNALILTSLVFSVKWLQNRWNNRYLVYTSNMLVSGTTVNTPDGQCTLATLPGVHDVFRNCAITFTSEATPVIDQDDEYPIVIAASILLRRSVITSSLTAFSNWSTPDLSYSNVSSHRALMDLMNADLKALDEFFKKRLASPQKSSFPIAADEIRLTYAGMLDIIPPY
jgi:hypothetical protein